jgi:hypothetical protein
VFESAAALFDVRVVDALQSGEHIVQINAISGMVSLRDARKTHGMICADGVDTSHICPPPT